MKIALFFLLLRVALVVLIFYTVIKEDWLTMVVAVVLFALIAFVDAFIRALLRDLSEL